MTLPRLDHELGSIAVLLDFVQPAIALRRSVDKQGLGRLNRSAEELIAIGAATMAEFVSPDGGPTEHDLVERMLEFFDNPPRSKPTSARLNAGVAGAMSTAGIDMQLPPEDAGRRMRTRNGERVGPLEYDASAYGYESPRFWRGSLGSVRRTTPGMCT